MRTNRIKVVGAATVGALALSLTGLAGTAQADLADDLQIMAGNVPAAVDTIVTGVQTAIDNYEAGGYGYPITQLVYDISDLPGQVAGVLASGTEQFGSLGLGVAVLAGTPAGLIVEYLIALDEDPASVIDKIDPNDISIILSNVPDAVAAAEPWVIETIAEGLTGNLVDNSGFLPGIGTPAVLGSAVAGLTEGFRALIAGTTFTTYGWDYTIGGFLLVPAGAAGPYVGDLEDALAPVFEALAPVTTPIAEALTNF